MIPLSIKTQRAWRETEGYRYLAPWTNLVLLRILVRVFTSSLPKGEYRLVHQMDDAARSAMSTLEEGWKRPTTKEYLDFLGFSQGSLEEIKGDVRRSLEDGFLKSKPGTSLQNLGIDLKNFKEFMGPRNLKRVRGKYLKETFKGSFKGNSSNQSSNQSFNKTSNVLQRDLVGTDYPSLARLAAKDLTFEVFMELINKTDYLLRNLVTSLQKSGTANENLKKDPRAAQEKEFDKWIDDVMKKAGEKNYRKL